MKNKTFLKKILSLTLILLTNGCFNSEKPNIPINNEVVATTFTATFSSCPTPPALSVCDGVVSLTKSVVTCKDNNGADVDLAFCDSLAQNQVCNYLSPSGTLNVLIPHGIRFDYCTEGGSLPSSQTYFCETGYFNENGSCVATHASKIIMAESLIAGAYSFVIYSDGVVKASGKNEHGQLGDGTTINRSSPVSIPGYYGAKSIATQYSASCAIMSDNTVKCSGYGFLGQLGNGLNSDTHTPTSVPGLTNVIKLVASASNFCALITNGDVYCWGANSIGLFGLGHNNVVQSATLSPAFGPATDIAMTDNVFCSLLQNGTVKCAGASVGSLSCATDVYTPQSVDGLTSPVLVFGGTAGGICAKNSDSTVSCWGGPNDVGVVNLSACEATQVPSFNGAVDADISLGLIGYIKYSDGKVRTVGYGSKSMAGIGQTGNSMTMMDTAFDGAVSLASTDQLTCAVMSDYSVKCSGVDTSGESGVLGTNSNIIFNSGY